MTLSMSLRVQFLLMQFFLLYIINGITQLNAIDPCGVLLGDFIFTVF